MQVKPRFDFYKFLEHHPIIKDDTGNELCLTLVEAKLPSYPHEFVESTYKFWTIIGRNQRQWNNKAVSYESTAFWKSKERKLLKIELNGLIIEELTDGTHYVFAASVPPKEEIGCRTTFIISSPKKENENKINTQE
jgi:hypothetical protein